MRKGGGCAGQVDASPEAAEQVDASLKAADQFDTVLKTAEQIDVPTKAAEQVDALHTVEQSALGNTENVHLLRKTKAAVPSYFNDSCTGEVQKNHRKISTSVMFLHIYVQSLKNKLNELQYQLENLNCTVISVNEHWLSNEELKLSVPLGCELEPATVEEVLNVVVYLSNE
ncbi:uncharacterized protein LOC126473341 [Schistocerca serialis cubense]|uniref:uncharacterized protein LOC126473341 n=1 Tax=Schistocerca serialis cubense TaxID=2023355 RepID=UPI00214E0C47|nr:uncharacterized protein LOC126473341 [Schistocerca serialis cubense]